MLGSPPVLRTITGLTVVGRQDNTVAKDWMLHFAPGLRYGNPMLRCEFRPAKEEMQLATTAAADAPVATSPGEKAGPEEPSAAGVKELAVAASGGGDQEQQAAGSASGATVGSNAEEEYVELQFTDGTQHLMNLALYRQSHQVMQRIFELDTEKGLAGGGG